MRKIDDGGPAFPRQLKQVENPQSFEKRDMCAQSGMSLRDWFAGQALAGVMANPMFAHIGDEARNAIALDQADKLLAASKAVKP